MKTKTDLERVAALYDYEALRSFDCTSEFISSDFGNVAFLADLISAGRVSEPPADSEGAACFGGVCEGFTHTTKTTAPAVPSEGSGSPLTNRGNEKPGFSDIKPLAVGCKLVSGGFDGGCEAGYTGEWNTLLKPLFFARLERAKTAVEAGAGSLAYVVFGGHCWHVLRSGARVGGIYYAYVVECHGVKVYFHAEPKGDIQPVRVRFGSDCLYFCNLFSAAAFLRRVLAAVGFRVHSEIVSRVDCQVTLSGVTVGDFYADLSRPGCLVTRSSGGCETFCNMKTGVLETITFKSSSMELCIYDKHSQVLTLDDVAFRAFMSGGIRGYYLPRDLTRLEFRFRRDVLKRYGVDSFDDLRQSVLALVDMASSDWFRVLMFPTSKGHRSEVPASALWVFVRQAFLTCFADSAISSRPLVRRVRPRSRDVDSLFRKAAGMLARAASLELPLVEGVDEIYDFFDSFFKKFGNKVYERCRAMQLESVVSTGFTAGSSCRDMVVDDMCKTE